MKVRNMKSPAGNMVPNQFVVTTDEGEYFQSYQTVVAWRGNDGSIKIDRWGYQYSPTTSKYMNRFFGFKDAKEANETIAEWFRNGRAVFTHLNE